MGPGKVNGWWVVATAAALIGFDLMSEPELLTYFVPSATIIGLVVGIVYLYNWSMK